MEEVLINSNIKGKRTKRQRPQSPIPFHNDDTNASQRACAAEDFLNNSTEEEEDMANCLILLAQCESPKQDHDHYNHNIKFNSKRFLEPPSAGTGKSGYYVYECKTCNRTFPSFQALGGHRASHKKPKAMSQQQQRPFLVSNSDEEDGNFRNVSSLSLQLSGNNNNNRGGNSNLHRSSSNMKSNKIHECSICGAEFTSGQALGGHMRRHRAAPAAITAAANTKLSLTPITVDVEESRKSRNNMLCLDLDLNLPAPEDDMRESKLPFSSKQQQQKSSLVFSVGPALVDCHY